jgi:hypothetical protein
MAKEWEQYVFKNFMHALEYLEKKPKRPWPGAVNSYYKLQRIEQLLRVTATYYNEDILYYYPASIVIPAFKEAPHKTKIARINAILSAITTFRVKGMYLTSLIGNQYHLQTPRQLNYQGDLMLVPHGILIE